MYLLYQIKTSLFVTALRINWSPVWELLSSTAQCEETDFAYCVISPASAYGCSVLGDVLRGSSGASWQEEEEEGGDAAWRCDVMRKTCVRWRDEWGIYFIPHRALRSCQGKYFSVSRPQLHAAKLVSNTNHLAQLWYIYIFFTLFDLLLLLDCTCRLWLQQR